MDKKSSIMSNKYSFFTNEYLLTEEICAEAEISRIDVGLVIAWLLLTFMFFMMMPSIPSMIYDYFSSPSPGTILSLSGGVVITILPSFVIILLIAKTFPRKAGAKRFQEQLQLVPGEKRNLSFYDAYVEITGKFKKKLPYTELKRMGETRNLYILYFTEKRILLIPKAGFHKGTLTELKSFIRKRRTIRSKLYGFIHWLPALCFLLLCCYAIWEQYA